MVQGDLYKKAPSNIFMADSSWNNAPPGGATWIESESPKRLRWLGDRIYDQFLVEAIYYSMPTASSEGLTLEMSHLHSKDVLAKCFLILGLDQYASWANKTQFRERVIEQLGGYLYLTNPEDYPAFAAILYLISKTDTFPDEIDSSVGFPPLLNKFLLIQ